MDELITDRRLLIQTGLVLGLVLLGFLFHGALHLEPATIALAGAALLLLVTRRDPQEILVHVEWSTLLFFVGLFISVEALVSVGIIRWIASALLGFTHANLGGATMFILWFSALASGIIDNIPYTAAMIPLIQSLGETVPTQPLWWALALGADFGGNLTIVAASANLVVASIAARGGYRLSFGVFLRYGVVTVLVTMMIASAYVWLRYL
jgi:Na+/H+ antiporter NhaD/arsenite permease-like protein